MTTIYCTPEEQKVFEALPAKLQDCWEIENEGAAVRDDAAHRAMRLQLLHLHDPKLQEFVRRAGSIREVDALTAIILGTDLKSVADADLAELCFALGPVPLTRIIADLLKKAKTDDDLEGIQAIALVRHSLLSTR